MDSNSILYNNPLTVNGIKMSLIFNAVGRKPDIREIKLHLGEQKSAAFLAINPEGKIPVLLDEGQVFTESMAILHYLANKYQSSLWPKSPALQSQTLKWLFWLSGRWNSAAMPFAHRRVVLPAWGFPDVEDVSSDVQAEFNNLAGQLDVQLSDKAFLCGDDVTLADLACGSYLIFQEQARIPIEEHDSLYRWFGRLKEFSWWRDTESSLNESLSEFTQGAQSASQ